VFVIAKKLDAGSDPTPTLPPRRSEYVTSSILEDYNSPCAAHVKRYFRTDFPRLPIVFIEERRLPFFADLFFWPSLTSIRRMIRKPSTQTASVIAESNSCRVCGTVQTVPVFEEALEVRFVIFPECFID